MNPNNSLPVVQFAAKIAQKEAGNFQVSWGQVSDCSQRPRSSWEFLCNVIIQPNKGHCKFSLKFKTHDKGSLHKKSFGHPELTFLFCGCGRRLTNNLDPHLLHQKLLVNSKAVNFHARLPCLAFSSSLLGEGTLSQPHQG